MKVTYLYIAIVVIGLAVFLFFNTRAVSAPESEPGSDLVLGEGQTSVDDFAQCLTDAGAKFYGAFWCPHCQEQKKLFNESDKLPYVECSLPNGEGQTPACAEEGIKVYPTWRFKDGTELGGALGFNKAVWILAL